MSNRFVSNALDFFGFGQGLNGEDVEYIDSPDGDHARREPSGIYPLRTERSDFSGMAIVRAKPTTIDEAPQVAEQIKDHLPVVVNLEDVTEPEARRIVDFLGGVVYGVDGSMKKLARSVFICSPFDIPIEQLAIAGGRSGPDDLLDEESADVLRNPL